MTGKKFVVGSKIYLHDAGFPYEKYEEHPGKVLAVNAGANGKYVYVEVLTLDKRKSKRERYLFHPEQISRERNSGVLALWKELEASQKRLAKIAKVLEKVVDWE